MELVENGCVRDVSESLVYVEVVPVDGDDTFWGVVCDYRMVVACTPPLPGDDVAGVVFLCPSGCWCSESPVGVQGDHCWESFEESGQ